MSRSTQFIGLTNDALRYVENAYKTEYFHLTDGMFGEEIYGRRFYLHPPDGPNQYEIAEEEVCDTPWSSGPMIFTCLSRKLKKEIEDERLLDRDRCFVWTLNPMLHHEVDYEKGHYYA